MIRKECKRLAEVDFPIAVVSRHAAIDCYWHYVVINCKAETTSQPPVKDPARFPWQEITKVEHYRLDVQAIREGG